MAQEETVKKLGDTMGMIYVEGKITRVASTHIGIYIYDRYAKRIADFVGRRVKLIILDVSDD